MIKKVAYIVAIIATLLSTAWFYVEGGYEPIIVFLFGVATVFGMQWKSATKVIVKLVPELVYINYTESGDIESFVYSENAEKPTRDPYSIGAKVTNLSDFPVIVSEIGFFIKGSTKRIVFAEPFVANDKGFPTKVEPSESITYTLKPDEISVFCQGKKIRSMFVKTDCGFVISASNNALMGNSKIET